MDKTPVSIIILAPFPDQGMKSLGNKSLFKIKNKNIIDYQLENIRSAFGDIEHDITLVCNFDCQRIQKALNDYDKKFAFKIIKQNDPNINFAGSFISGIQQVKYNRVLSINYGLLFTKKIIQKLTKKTENNTVAIARSQSYNDNINTGCYINDTEIIHIFFNLGEHKYLDINFWSEDTISYIKNNFLFDNYKNRFMFEVINELISCKHVFRYMNMEPKECLMIDSTKMLNKSQRVFQNVKTYNKKTKY